jgi:hypothetical protein
MPDINNDDLDNLFRRAAEDYPLRTNSSDWDKVARELDEGEDDASFIIPPVYTGEEKNKRRKILLLLLLLPLLGIGYYFFSAHSSSSIKNIAGTPVNSGKNDVVQKTETTDKRVINKEANNNANQKDAVNKSADSNNSVDKKDLAAITKNQNTKSNEKISATDNAIHVKSSENEIRNSNSSNSTKNNLANNNNSASKNKKGKTVFEKIFENNYSSSTESKNLLNTGINNNETSNAELQRVSGFSIISVSDKNISSPDINNKNLRNSAASFIKTDSSPVNNKKKTAGKKQSSFYAGIIVAPDLSTIKFQSVKGTGYTAGILLGYNISKKIAVETGAYYDYKKYYTEGEYFHSKQPFLSYVDLQNVNGVCRMIEVPVNLKYNFITSIKTKWFATTGLSSYFMFKEGYTYNYLYNGTPGQKYYSYNSGSQNWFSVLNISAGYEHSIGNIGNLRLEPYLRIPLSGMGTGSLPIMSVGLNVGITHSFK